MLRLIFVSILFSFSLANSAFGQLTYGFKKSKYYTEFLTRDLAVELSGNKKFDEALKESVESIWSGKKEIIYVTHEEIPQLPSDKYSVLGVIRITKNYDGYEISKQTGIGLYIPSSRTFGSYMYNVLGYVPFSCYTGGGQTFKNESECNYPEEILYKIDLMNHMIYQLIEFVGQSRRRGFSPPAFMNQYNFLNRKERFSLMETKTLLVNEDDLNESFTKEKFEGTYRYNAEIVSSETYKQILLDGSDKYLALISGQNTQYNLSIIDLESKKMLGVQYGVAQLMGSSKGTEMNKSQIKMLQKKKIISNLNRNRIIRFGLIGFVVIGNILT